MSVVNFASRSSKSPRVWVSVWSKSLCCRSFRSRRAIISAHNRSSVGVPVQLLASFMGVLLLRRLRRCGDGPGIDGSACEFVEPTGDAGEFDWHIRLRGVGQDAGRIGDVVLAERWRIDVNRRPGGTAAIEVILARQTAEFVAGNLRVEAGHIGDQ